MKRHILTIIILCSLPLIAKAAVKGFPKVNEQGMASRQFALYNNGVAATICTDNLDYPVVGIAAGLLADDVERVTAMKPAIAHPARLKDVKANCAVIAGTIGKSNLIDELVAKGKIHVDEIRGKWESFLVTTIEKPTKHIGEALIIVGSDRRGTAFGLLSLSEAIGVSPWYWWADVVPQHQEQLMISRGTFIQGEPSVKYRGIFINDERFGGWARWAEENFDKEHHEVGPKTYRKVFELLLRLKGNYLWPAMHPGTKPFNFDPENALLADDYAIVMGTSHCEQMLRNNEGEWKAVGTYGDFNYITNRQTMQNYWEERIKTNGRYENTYTLGLRGVHDYPMEGANTTQERVRLMQQAINDQRDMLRRNINKPIEEIPQVLCTYEEVLDAYHNGLQVPEDVTLLWSDDKHGYCRNLSNPGEQQRKGGAGIYYHLSYHGDPASWIWLSPLSPSFIATELTKAYTFGAKKIWVFNVGDIKPAEKEISFAMDLAWDINRWKPTEAHNYIKYWTTKTFGPELAQEIADLQARYYKMQAAGKDAHVWFVNYTEQQAAERVREAQALAREAASLAERVPQRLKDAFFELFVYPISGAAMLNEYQLLAKRSMVSATRGDSLGAMADAHRVEQMFKELNQWTKLYNKEIRNGKWDNFFNWQPYHWFRSEKIDPPICTPKIFEDVKKAPAPRFIPVSEALAAQGAIISCEKDGEIPIWMEALTPVRNFSKAPEDNVFCHVKTASDSFDASATPINNVWHSPWIGPMWSRVGTIHLKKGQNKIAVTELKPGASIDKIFIGLWPPYPTEPRLRLAADNYQKTHNAQNGHIETVVGLGYADGVTVLPFDTPSYNSVEDAPYVEYTVELQENDSKIEIRTLPTLHVYEGRDARYAVRLGDAAPTVFSIHEGDFTSEWRLNVLRGYASRTIDIPSSSAGKQTVRIYFLDPGIVLQDICIY